MEKNTNPTAPIFMNNPSSTPPQQLKRTFSMEEPKTLSEAELAAFREAALNIINTHTPEEATRIFMGGLETATMPKAVEFGAPSKEEK